MVPRGHAQGRAGGVARRVHRRSCAGRPGGEGRRAAIEGAVGILDDIFWKALTGPQAHFASGAGAARRYARGFSPILGFADREHPDFTALEPFCAPGERFYVDTWSGPAPPGWTIAVDKK